MKVLGWDIGGAHLKAALAVRGKIARVWQLPCPLWIELKPLIDNIAVIAGEAGSVDLHVLTMTGELCDSFVDRQDGVNKLLAIFSGTLPKTAALVYAHPGKFISMRQAAKKVDAVASVNWLATANWVATRCEEAILIDIGSTTTDIVPISRGRVMNRGVTDAQRLACEELVYTGVVRTPVMAIVDRVPFAGEWRAIMSEHFATSADVYRLTQELPAGADQMPTADGRGKTRIDSARRLARIIGSDAASAEEWEQCAHYVADVQLWNLYRASARVISSVALSKRAPVIGAGVGRFVAKKLAQRQVRPYRDLASQLPLRGADERFASICAPASCIALLGSDITLESV